MNATAMQQPEPVFSTTEFTVVRQGGTYKVINSRRELVFFSEDRDEATRFAITEQAEIDAEEAEDQRLAFADYVTQLVADADLATLKLVLLLLAQAK